MHKAYNIDDLMATLRDTEPYIADDGFSAAIVSRLPEARQLPFWLSSLILLVFTGIGSSIAAWQLPAGKLVDFAMHSVVSLPVVGIAAISTFLIAYIVIWLAQNDSI